MMLPGHIVRSLESGQTPEPTEFSTITLFFTDIYNFKRLVSSISDASKILELLNVLYDKFDQVISKYDGLYKVECVSDTYMVASGLNHSEEKSSEEIETDAHTALRCCSELQQVASTIDLKKLGIDNFDLKIRIGIHSGPVSAGLIGTKMSRYCLFGDTVNTASRMCTNSEPGKICVSPKTHEIMKDYADLVFEERGEISVKGKGQMMTYWLEC
jgi:atrial natriuretic peptide receptor A